MVTHLYCDITNCSVFPFTCSLKCGTEVWHTKSATYFCNITCSLRQSQFTGLKDSIELFLAGSHGHLDKINAHLATSVRLFENLNI